MQDEAESARTAFRNAEKSSNKELETASAALENDGGENFRTELKYHRKLHHRAEDVDNLIQKYDEEMIEKHEAFRELEKVYEAEKKELEKLTAYFDEVDAENKRLKEEHASIKQRRDQELEDERKRNDSAMLVQKLFASHQARVIKQQKKEAKLAKQAAAAKK